jgi:hypothetical protein
MYSKAESCYVIFPQDGGDEVGRWRKSAANIWQRWNYTLETYEDMPGPAKVIRSVLAGDIEVEDYDDSDEQQIEELVKDAAETCEALLESAAEELEAAPDLEGETKVGRWPEGYDADPLPGESPREYFARHREALDGAPDLEAAADEGSVPAAQEALEDLDLGDEMDLDEVLAEVSDDE